MPEELKGGPAAPDAAAAAAANKAVTPPTPAPAPAPTPEELELEAAEFIESQFGGAAKKPKAKEPAAAEAAVPAPEKEKKEPETPEPPAEGGAGKAKKKYTPGKKAEATLEQMEAVARRVQAEERAAENEPEPAREADPARPEAVPADLSDENRDTLEVLAEMESGNPRYQGLGRAVQKFWKAEEQYRGQWQAKNPDEPFNPEDPAHNDFYRKNQPQYTPADYKIAARAIIEKGAATRAEQNLRKEWEPKFKKIEAEARLREAQPQIANSVGHAVEDIFKAAPDFEKLVEPGNLSEEAVAKMAEINPVIHHHVTEEAEYVMGVVSELEKLHLLGEHHEFNASQAQRLSSGRVIYPHALINDTFRELEERLSKAPKADRLDEGRDFLTNAHFTERVEMIRAGRTSVEAKKRALAQLKADYWVISPEHVRQRIIDQSRARIAGLSKKFGHLSKTGGDGGSGKNGETTPAPEAARPTAKAGLAKGTATASVSDTQDNAGRAGAGAGNEDEEFVKNAFN